MKGNCFPFILIILIIFGCVFVKKENQIREAFGGFKEGFREGQPQFGSCVENDVVNVNGAWRNCCVRCGTGYSATSSIGDGGRCITCGIAPPPPPPRLCSSYGCPCGFQNTGSQQCANNSCTQTQCCSKIPKETIPHCTSQLSWGRNCAKCDPEGWELSNAPKKEPDKKVGGGGDRYFRPNGVLDPKTWTNCGTNPGSQQAWRDAGEDFPTRCTVKDPRGKYWFRCSNPGGSCGKMEPGSSNTYVREWTEQEKVSGIPCIATMCQKAMEGGAIHDKKVPGGGDRYFRPNGVLDPKTWKGCGTNSTRCKPKDPRGKYWFRTSGFCMPTSAEMRAFGERAYVEQTPGSGGAVCAAINPKTSSTYVREMTEQEKVNGIPCHATMCYMAMEGGAIHDKAKSTTDKSAVQPTCGSQTVPSPPLPDCFKQVSPDCKKIAQVPIDNCIRQRDWGKSCITCAVGYKMSSDKTRCDLIPIPFCKTQEREVCQECEEAYRIGKTGRTCDRIPKAKIPHCTNQRDWGAYCYECGSDLSGYMVSENKEKCIPRPISNCKDQEEIRCNKCRFGYSKSLDWKSCDIVAIKDCAIQNKSICTECKMGYKMGEDRRKCDLLSISNCQERYEGFSSLKGFGTGRIFSKAS